MKRNFALFIFLILALSCSNSIASKARKLNNSAPFGTKMVGENIYIDKTEVTNVNYVEYLYWTKRVYGIESKAYKNALPKKNTWMFADETNRYYTIDDLKNPKKYQYSVLGVNEAQAKIYAQWRTDRVAQAILIRLGVIELTRYETPEEHFTIARYLNGKYIWTIKQLKELIVPVYSLPTTDEKKLYGNEVEFNYLVDNFRGDLDVAGRPSYAKGFWCIARYQKFIATDGL